MERYTGDPEDLPGLLSLDLYHRPGSGPTFKLPDRSGDGTARAILRRDLL